MRSKTVNLRRLSQVGPVYWLESVLLILAGLALSLWLNRFEWWQQAGHVAYNALVVLSPATTTYPKKTVVVLIDDDDYWRGEWARRVPLKRDTLARLLREIRNANAKAIGVDVDLRSQTEDGLAEHPDYRAETAELLAAADEIAREIPVVFVNSMTRGELNELQPAPDLFDRHRTVDAGHAYLPPDTKQVPLSYGSAAAREESLTSRLSERANPRSLKTALDRAGTSGPYVRRFFSEEEFRESDAYVSAGSVLARDPRALALLLGKTVLVGGGWHLDSLGKGPRVDEHMTPRGRMPGVFIHANYVEAVATEEVVRPSGKAVHIVSELVVGLLLAAIFVCAIGYWKIVYILGLGIAVIFASLVFWSNLGIFVDSAPPLILLTGHALLDKVLGWKRVAAHHHAAHPSCTGGEHG